MVSNKIGIIGGTGMKSLHAFHVDEEKTVITQYGNPSSPLLCGKIDGVPCVILSRHGSNHSILPSNVNYRANLLALKNEGCTHVIATTACGSLKESIKPGDFVILDQFIDRTTKRTLTYYDGMPDSFKGVCHIPMKKPFCSEVGKLLSEACKSCGINCHSTGTMITIEGPRFSTLAESKLFQSWGASVINMTTVPEVVLANELGLLYVSIALVTDYDCWKEDENGVSVEAVMKIMAKNGVNAAKAIAKAIPVIGNIKWDCLVEKHVNASKNSII